MRFAKVLASILAASSTVVLLWAQANKILTPQDLFKRNVGTKEDQDTAFPPHKIAGNLYYVGTRSLGTFLVTTPQGDILINTDYERTVPVIKSSVEKLGFKFTDIKIILGSHAHGDHMEGDALVEILVHPERIAEQVDHILVCLVRQRVLVNDVARRAPAIRLPHGRRQIRQL